MNEVLKKTLVVGLHKGEHPGEHKTCTSADTDSLTTAETEKDG